MQLLAAKDLMLKSDNLVKRQKLGDFPHMVTQDQVDSFHQFATSQIATVGSELSLDQLYSLWRAKHPAPQELAASVTALKSAYADLEAGDAGRPARLALRESCQRLGVVIDE
jgi:hypothetical protein